MKQQLISDPGLTLDFLAGGGAMGERIRAYPWASTPLGEPQFWPQGLRTAVRVLLATQHPIFIFWGPQHTCFYNDAYSRSLGTEKHPAILGASGRESWEEIWPIIGPQLEQVMRGEGATWHENQLVPILRHGALQEVYWTYSYSPIDEPASPQGVGGVLVICTETTEQVLAGRRLSAERERFVQLFDQAPTFLALLRGPDHVIELVNPGYQKLVGHRAVVGRKVSEALPEAVEQGFVALLDRVYSSGQPFSAFGAKWAAQSSPRGAVDERYVDFVYQPITESDGSVSGILVQGVDVTSRAATDQALMLNRARLDYATRLSGIGFWYCDLPFDELQWDERVKDHFFFPPTARITIEDFYNRIHEADRLLTREAIDASIRNRLPYDIVYRTVHPTTGAIKWIRALGGTDYASDGTPTRFDGVTVDVSAEKLDQQRLAKLNHQLREQDRRKDEFLATLAHELRNPLAPIRTAARILGSKSVTGEKISSCAEIIQRQTKSMALLLDDLLDISRISSNKLQLKKLAVTASSVIQSAVETARPIIDARGHTLSLTLPDKPLTIDADPLRLAQVITNLLTNAAKYTDSNGRIEIAALQRGAQVEISVRDNGIGLSAADVGRVFDMFSQVDSALERAQGGLGIGLALVRGIIELHGGEAFARSEGLGKGSEFVLKLPIGPPRDSLDELDPLASTATTTRHRILVADDNVDARDTLLMLLELSGHDLRSATGGREALSICAAWQPELAILDIGMPEMNGYEVAERLRRESWGKAIVLVALTGWGDEKNIAQARVAGFDHHLTKPIDLDKLDQLIKQALAVAAR